ncbi:CFEM domain-containing protein [Colletotrichum tofieldiae]|uniref:CFEM domain-containing protein n=1 Tax=Colletotrichum tofieldiae TaxID=708197 RepID=A0A166YYF0_9PEZI|nr:CFEM domain-containing protein [Colletotrichum tofieldiae]
MGFHYYIIALTFGLATAQSTITSSATSTATSLPSLVSQIPSCAAGCLPKVGTETGCGVADFECMCSDIGSFVAHMGVCLLKHGCSKDDTTKASNIGEDICDAVSSNTDAAAIASASSLVTAAVAKATATNSATNMEFGYGAVGAGALAVALML